MIEVRRTICEVCWIEYRLRFKIKSTLVVLFIDLAVVPKPKQNNVGLPPVDMQNIIFHYLW